MKRRLLAFILLGAALGVFLISSAAAEMLSVKVRAVRLRSAPKFWAASSSGLTLGTQVTKLAREGDWFRVKTTSGQEGYLHSSVLTDKRIVLSSSALPGKDVDQTDMVMAGKGFSPEVERAYAARDKSLNYGAVTAMERIKVDDAELAAFMKQGKLGKGAL